MGKTTRITLEFRNNPKGVFFPGQVVCGDVVVNDRASIRVKCKSCGK